VCVCVCVCVCDGGGGSCERARACMCVCDEGRGGGGERQTCVYTPEFPHDEMEKAMMRTRMISIHAQCERTFTSRICCPTGSCRLCYGQWLRSLAAWVPQ
jgi:hypothetical protein